MDTKVAALANKIAYMVDALSEGRLKRTARDFISGLVDAYGIMVDIDDAEQALDHALKAAGAK